MRKKKIYCLMDFCKRIFRGNGLYRGFNSKGERKIYYVLLCGKGFIQSDFFLDLYFGNFLFFLGEEEGKWIKSKGR